MSEIIIITAIHLTSARNYKILQEFRQVFVPSLACTSRYGIYGRSQMKLNIKNRNNIEETVSIKNGLFDTNRDANEHRINDNDINRYS